MFNTNWKPDPLASIPLHKQIEEYIKMKILQGDWTVGMRLPSQRELAKAFNVNRSTVVTAMEELKAQGLIVGKSGGGTIVINNTWSLLNSTPPPDWKSYVDRGIYKPNLPTIQEINQAEFRPGIIRLGTGELSPDLLPTKPLQTIFKRYPQRKVSLGYEEPKGNMFLREQVTTYLKEIGIHTSPASILIVSGSLQALQLVSIGLLNKDSTILLERPSYLYSVNVFQSAGMKLFGIPMDDHGLQTSMVAKLNKQRKAAMIYTIPSFHNPTGTLMSAERRNELYEICKQEQLPVLEDDAYRDLWFDTPPPQPLKSLDRHGLVLYLGSMSKALSPGLRIGWIVGPESVIDRLADIKMQTDYGSSSLSQWAVAELLSTHLYQEHIEQIRKQLKLRRDIAIAALEKHLDKMATWNVPQGSFYIWVRIIPSLSQRQLFEKALQSGILINPGNLYDRDASKYLRISYSYASLVDLEYGIAKLGEIVKSMVH